MNINENMNLDEIIKLLKSNDYKDRIKGEFYLLVNKEKKLDKMLYKYENDKLDFVLKSSIGILYTQLHIMRSYISILVQRMNEEGIEL